MAFAVHDEGAKLRLQVCFENLARRTSTIARRKQPQTYIIDGCAYGDVRFGYLGVDQIAQPICVRAVSVDGDEHRRVAAFFQPVEGTKDVLVHWPIRPYHDIDNAKLPRQVKLEFVSVAKNRTFSGKL
jgi:hypothetical protein